MSEDLRAQLDELQVAARDLSVAGDRIASGTPSSADDPAPVITGEGSVTPVERTVSAVQSAARQLGHLLPDCPFAPPGSALQIQFLAGDNTMVYRCAHEPEAHCWYGPGSSSFLC